MDDFSYVTAGLAFIGVGILLLLGEFYLPVGGALAVIAVAVIAMGVALTFFYSVFAGLMTLAGVSIAMPVSTALAMSLWYRTPIGRRIILTAPDPDDTVSAMPGLQNLERLRGRYGKALSDLRPAGVVDFDGRRIDTLTEGMMVEEGQWVKCVAVRAGKVIVRPSERPDLDNMKDAFFSE
jgi:membrane-bound serine protease (ClpP class)